MPLRRITENCLCLGAEAARARKAAEETLRCPIACPKRRKQLERYVQFNANIAGWYRIKVNRSKEKKKIWT